MNRFFNKLLFVGDIIYSCIFTLINVLFNLCFSLEVIYRYYHYSWNKKNACQATPTRDQKRADCESSWLDFLILSLVLFSPLSRPPLTPPCCLNLLLLPLTYLVNLTQPLTPPRTCLLLHLAQAQVSFLPAIFHVLPCKITCVHTVQMWNESSLLVCAGFLKSVSLSGPVGLQTGDQDLSLGQYWTRLQWDSEQPQEAHHQNETHHQRRGSGQELRKQPEENPQNTAGKRKGKRITENLLTVNFTIITR